MISGDKNFVLLLFLSQLVVASGLLVGFRTRLVTVLSWALLLSLHNRNPMLQYGGDQILLLTLFWGMFLPWGRRWSADELSQRQMRRSAVVVSPAAQGDAGEEGNRVYSVATMAYLIQVCMIFFTAGLLKNGAEWIGEFTAVYYALANYEYEMPLGAWLLQAGPGLQKILTISTLLAEMGLPLLLFLPVFRPLMRMVFFGGIFLMQLGFGLSLTLGIFPFVGTIVCLGLLPGEFWDRLAPRLARLSHRLAPAVNVARTTVG